MENITYFSVDTLYQNIEHCPGLNIGCISQTSKCCFPLGAGMVLETCACGIFCVAGDLFAGGTPQPDASFCVASIFLASSV